jgi:hypothetical protein
MADKPKRKYIRRTVKNTKPEKDPDDIQGFTESVGRGKSAIDTKFRKGVLHENESYITDKIMRGEKPTDEDFQKYLKEFGFKDGKIPEPVELPLDIQEGNEMESDPIPEPPSKKTKRCPKGTRRNKSGDCVPVDSNGKKTKIVIHPEEDKKKKEKTREDKEDKKPEAKSAMNRFLDEKEKLEREHPLEHHDYLYPDLNDPNFNIKIALKKEFQDAQYDGQIRDIEKQADLLCKAKFELSPHQVFVKNFLSADTPYKGLLLYHGLGTGKTCSAIGVAEEMRQYMKRTGLKRQIFVVASPNVQGNFRQQLFDERKLTKVTNAANPNEFTWNIESCVGNSLINEINPNSIHNLSREKLISNINSLINENYVFLGYIQFANVAKAHMLVQTGDADKKEQKSQEENSIRKFFDDRLIIIDEVHNIRLADDSNRKEMQQVAAVLMKVVKHARGLRLLLLSATPMFNSYREIIWITNLLNSNDGRSQIQTSDVFENDGTFKKGTSKESGKDSKESGKDSKESGKYSKESGKDSKESGKGEDILRRKLTGYISYVRGENPYTFPYRLYPTVFSPENALKSFVYPRIQMNGIEIDSPIQNINVYVNRVLKTTYQMQVYLSIIDYMRRKSHGFYTNAGIYREMPNFENMESFGYTLLQRPLESLNIVYPDEDISQMLRTSDRANQYSDDLFQNAVGGTGLAKVVSFATMENDEPLKHDYEYQPATLKKHGRIFSPENIPKYSVKIAEICNAVKKSEGIVLIYSQYIDGGVVPIALALEEMGLSRYSSGLAGRHRHLFKKAPTSPVDALSMLPRSEMPNPDSFQPAQYIMITGDKGLSPSNNDDVKYATNRDNMDGSKVKVIIISKAGSEGLDFKAIRQIHILEPWFNMNRIEQIIGRGVRNLSHCSLPFRKRNVQIYLHSTFIEGAEEEAADLYLYRLAEKKASQIGKVTRLLKETAADCILHIGQTNFTAEKLSKIAANQSIRLELSSKNQVSGELREVDFQIGDLDGSEICDYMSCEYQCRPKAPQRKDDDEENKQSYTEQNLQSNIYYIIGRIKELFRERHVYTLAQICAAINVVRVYPIVQIYYALTKFVDNRSMVLFDKYGRFGYLLNRGKYYEFQPVEITDARSSIRDRSVPVEYKRGNITLELTNTVGEKAVKPNKAKDVTKGLAKDVVKGVTRPSQHFEPVSYEDTVKSIHELIDVVKTQHTIKSTEMNWYKNTSKALEHLHIVHGFKEKHIIKYVIYHYLDSADYRVKRTLFERTIDDSVDTEIEKHIASYFRDSIMRTKSKEGIYIANREDAQLVVRDKEDETEWREGDKFDAEEFKDDMAKYMVDKKSLSDIVGYAIQFKDQDMSFYYKDIHLKRNKKGRRCDRSGGKAPIIDMLNRVVGSKMYTEENTSSIMYSGSLCVVLEMILRKFHDEGKSSKIYYLTPEQAIQSKITDYSSSI